MGMPVLSKIVLYNVKQIFFFNPKVSHIYCLICWEIVPVSGLEFNISYTQFLQGKLDIFPLWKLNEIHKKNL